MLLLRLYLLVRFCSYTSSTGIWISNLLPMPPFAGACLYVSGYMSVPIRLADIPRISRQSRSLAHCALLSYLIIFGRKLMNSFSLSSFPALMSLATQLFTWFDSSTLEKLFKADVAALTCVRISRQ